MGAHLLGTISNTMIFAGREPANKGNPARRMNQISGIALKNINEAISQLVESWDRTDQRAARKISRHGWVLPTNCRVSFLGKVAGLPSNTRRGKVSQLFQTEYFSRDCAELKRISAKWPTLQNARKRAPILISCVNTVHISIKGGIDPAPAVIPTLIAQIDGMLTDYLRRKKINFERPYDDRKNQIGRKGALRASKPDPQLPTTIHEHTLNFFLERLFKRYHPGSKSGRPPAINRHAIMHGHSTKYGTKENLLKILALVDFIAHLQ